MIKYELKCQECSHQFEGWFVDSAGYDAQATAREISCPVCADTNIGKAIMAPNIARRRGADDSSMSAVDTGAQVRSAMRTMRKELAANSDNVGEAFPEEARKIHYGEVEERAIHGEASLDEAKELVDEGIDVMPIPPLPESDA
jgi:hypothetical protein